jgi:hypothetical protein
VLSLSIYPSPVVYLTSFALLSLYRCTNILLLTVYSQFFNVESLYLSTFLLLPVCLSSILFNLPLPCCLFYLPSFPSFFCISLT